MRILCIFFWYILSCILQLSYSSNLKGGRDAPFCRPWSKLSGPPNYLASLFKPDGKYTTNERQVSHPRVYVIGDIHGDAIGLLEVLAEARVILRTMSPFECKWNPQLNDTTVIQMGDVIDRGRYSKEAFACLRELQETQARGNKMIRLVGNHELLWLNGETEYSNKATDTPDVKNQIISQLKEGILKGSIVGAYCLEAIGVPFLFTHAGLRPEMMKHIQNDIGLDAKSGASISAEEFASYINRELVGATAMCPTYSKKGLAKQKPCSLQGELFEAGPERGGKHIGGPFWTDFAVLSEVDTDPLRTASFVQIVGHTIEKNAIRVTNSMSAICVDGGMFIGGRVFLEIDPNAASVVAHTRAKLENNVNEWRTDDLTAKYC